MNNDMTTTNAVKEDKPDFFKRIGKTSYRVRVHFKPNSKETMQDKIIRMLLNEV